MFISDTTFYIHIKVAPQYKTGRIKN